MIEVSGLCCGYGSRTVLHDVGFTVPNGSLLSVLGMNGSGKSTLLKSLARLLRPTSGRISLNQQLLTDLNRQELARTVAYLSQNTTPLNCTVIEAVLIGRKPNLSWLVQEHDLQQTAEILKLTGLSDHADRPTYQLSGGELQRVAIARTLAQQPKLLLLDEPVNHLDIRSQLDIMALIRNLTAQLGIITIAVMHDLNTALRFCDQFLLLREGRIVANGGQEVMTAEHISAVYDLQVALQKIGGLTMVLPCPEQEPSLHSRQQPVDPLQPLQRPAAQPDMG